MLNPVKGGSLRDHLRSHLFDAILHGELQPGDRIVEGMLARRLGVAQATLREALQELEHSSLVTKSDRRGTFVTKLTVTDMEDIYVVRCELEPVAAALAYPHLTAENLKNLWGVVDHMREAGRRRAYVDLLKGDLHFHQLIWKLSGNRFIRTGIERCLSSFVCVLHDRSLFRTLVRFREALRRTFRLASCFQERRGDGGTAGFSRHGRCLSNPRHGVPASS